jgi:hypothetical protein
MWSKLFGGGDEMPRAKVDAVMRVIDRYLLGAGGRHHPPYTPKVSREPLNFREGLSTGSVRLAPVHQ